MMEHRARRLPVTRQLCLGIAFVNLSIVLAAVAGAAQTQKPIRIVTFGDSLTAGFNIAQKDAFPVQLERALAAKGHEVEVINASVSGDTTAAALARFDWAVPEDVDAAIVELGGNDALRGLPPAQMQKNLDAIVRRLKDRGIQVLLAGMKAPRNLGDSYVAAFDAVYPELAKTHDLVLYPFFLEGVALKAKLNLSDGVHPNPDGVAVIVQSILPSVEELLARVKAKRAGAARG